MTAPRLVILAILLVQAVLTGILTDTRLFPLFIIVLSLLAFARPLNVSFPRRQRIYGLLALALFFTVKMRFFPLDIQGRFSPFPNNYELNHTLSQGLLVLQVWLLASYRVDTNKRGAHAYALYAPLLLAALQLATIMDFVSRSAVYRQASLVGAGLFTALFAAYIFTATGSVGAPRRSFLRAGVCLTLLAAAIVSGAMLATVAAPNVMRLDAFFFQLLRPSVNTSATGLSERSTLQSVTAMRGVNQDRVVVRVQADRMPDYLRARAHDAFDGRTWQTTQAAEPLRPAQPPAGVEMNSASENYFALTPSATAPAGHMTVWPASATSLLLTTYDSIGIAALLPEIEADEHGSCKAREVLSGQYYRLYGGTAGDARAEDALLARCLQVPNSLSPEARAVALAAIEDARTTPEKIASVTGFLLSNFSYQMGITIPSGADPMSHFLTERPPAHCEYFASTAALMLRLGGVPSRYVVGFAITERNGAGGYWAARNRDAHAWVEAWDEHRGWVTVEATPPDGLPETQGTDALGSLWDALKFRAGRVLALVRREGIALAGVALQGMARWLTHAWSGRALLLVALGWGLHRAFLRYRRMPSQQRRTPEEKRYLRLLAQMDRQASRRGFKRLPHETLHQFAEALRKAERPEAWNTTAADWYETCSLMRFNGTPTNDVLDKLTQIKSRME